MAFAPLNDDHAVELTEFAIGFNRPLRSQLIHRVLAGHRQIAAELPAAALVNVSDLEGGLVAPLRSSTAPGVEFAFLRPDGNFIWRMRVAHNEILVSCALYTRWAAAAERALRLIEYVLSSAAAADKDLAIASVALRVVDRFTGEEGQYALEELLNRGSWIPDPVFEKGAMWHCNLGWFAESNHGSILHNLNMAGVIHDENGPDRQAQVAIGHQLQIRELRQQLPLDETTALRQHFDELHQENKAIVTSLLVQKIAEQIGLTQ